MDMKKDSFSRIMVLTSVLRRSISKADESANQS